MISEQLQKIETEIRTLKSDRKFMKIINLYRGIDLKKIDSSRLRTLGQVAQAVDALLTTK